MARSRKSATRTMTDAQERLTNLKSIDPALNLGAGLTNALYEAAAAQTAAKLDVYNQTLALLDAQLNEFEESEKELRDMSVRMLSGVGVKFGYDSSEYEQAGGTRKSERARPVRKPQNNP